MCVSPYSGICHYSVPLEHEKTKVCFAICIHHSTFVFGGPEQAAHSVCTPPSLPDWPLIRVTLMSLSTKEIIRKLTKIDIHSLFYHVLFYTSLTQ